MLSLFNSTPVSFTYGLLLALVYNVTLLCRLIQCTDNSKTKKYLENMITAIHWKIIEMITKIPQYLNTALLRLLKSTLEIQ